MDDKTVRRISSRLSIMFALGVVLAFMHAIDSSALTKLEAAAKSKAYSAASCEFRIPQGMRCMYRPMAWHYKHTEDVRTRRSGPWKFQRTYSKARFVMVHPGARFGMEFGCNTVVGAVYFAFGRISSSVRCSPDGRPALLGMAIIAGQYSY